MYSVTILEIAFISCLVIPVKSWNIKDDYYDKDYDPNKKCPDEERISSLLSIQNENLDLDQCFTQVWGKGGQQ